MLALWLAMGCGGSPDRGGADELAAGSYRGDELPVLLSAPSSSGRSTSSGASPPSDSDLESTDELDTLVEDGIVGIERYDASDTRRVFVRRVRGSPFTELVAAERVGEGWVEEVRLSGVANPDRPAISPDGETIAFVSGVSGIAAVWVVPFDGGADPVQITNLGLESIRRTPNQPPTGFIPPPATTAGGIEFSGDMLEWDGPDGRVVVRWH
jgi:hypothetical protein